MAFCAKRETSARRETRGEEKDQAPEIGALFFNSPRLVIRTRLTPHASVRLPRLAHKALLMQAIQSITWCSFFFLDFYICS